MVALQQLEKEKAMSDMILPLNDFTIPSQLSPPSSPSFPPSRANPQTKRDVTVIDILEDDGEKMSENGELRRKRMGSLLQSSPFTNLQPKSGREVGPDHRSTPAKTLLGGTRSVGGSKTVGGGASTPSFKTANSRGCQCGRPSFGLMVPIYSIYVPTLPINLFFLLR